MLYDVAFRKHSQANTSRMYIGILQTDSCVLALWQGIW